MARNTGNTEVLTAKKFADMIPDAQKGQPRGSRLSLKDIPVASRPSKRRAETAEEEPILTPQDKRTVFIDDEEERRTAVDAADPFKNLKEIPFSNKEEEVDQLRLRKTPDVPIGVVPTMTSAPETTQQTTSTRTVTTFAEPEPRVKTADKLNDIPFPGEEPTVTTKQEEEQVNRPQETQEVNETEQQSEQEKEQEQKEAEKGEKTDEKVDTAKEAEKEVDTTKDKEVEPKPDVDPADRLRDMKEQASKRLQQQKPEQKPGGPKSPLHRLKHKFSKPKEKQQPETETGPPKGARPGKRSRHAFEEGEGGQKTRNRDYRTRMIDKAVQVAASIKGVATNMRATGEKHETKTESVKWGEFTVPLNIHMQFSEAKQHQLNGRLAQSLMETSSSYKKLTQHHTRVVGHH